MAYDPGEFGPDIEGDPVWSGTLPGYDPDTTTDLAENFNQVHQALLNNDFFLRKLIEDAMQLGPLGVPWPTPVPFRCNMTWNYSTSFPHPLNDGKSIALPTHASNGKIYLFNADNTHIADIGITEVAGTPYLFSGFFFGSDFLWVLMSRYSDGVGGLYKIDYETGERVAVGSGYSIVGQDRVLPDAAVAPAPLGQMAQTSMTRAPGSGNFVVTYVYPEGVDKGMWAMEISSIDGSVVTAQYRVTSGGAAIGGDNVWPLDHTGQAGDGDLFFHIRCGAVSGAARETHLTLTRHGTSKTIAFDSSYMGGMGMSSEVRGRVMRFGEHTIIGGPGENLLCYGHRAFLTSDFEDRFLPALADKLGLPQSTP